MKISCAVVTSGLSGGVTVDAEGILAQDDELTASAPESTTFGRLVRARRLARGWSQEALAAEAFSNQDRKGYVSRIENGRIPKITRETVKSISRALDIDPEAIPPALRWPEAAAVARDTNSLAHEIHADIKRLFASDKGADRNDDTTDLLGKEIPAPVKLSAMLESETPQLRDLISTLERECRNEKPEIRYPAVKRLSNIFTGDALNAWYRLTSAEDLVVRIWFALALLRTQDQRGKEVVLQIAELAGTPVWAKLRNILAQNKELTINIPSDIVTYVAQFWPSKIFDSYDFFISEILSSYADRIGNGADYCAKLLQNMPDSDRRRLVKIAADGPPLTRYCVWRGFTWMRPRDWAWMVGTYAETGDSDFFALALGLLRWHFFRSKDEEPFHLSTSEIAVCETLACDLINFVEDRGWPVFALSPETGTNASMMLLAFLFVGLAAQSPAMVDRSRKAINRAVDGAEIGREAICRVRKHGCSVEIPISERTFLAFLLNLHLRRKGYELSADEKRREQELLHEMRFVKVRKFILKWTMYETASSFTEIEIVRYGRKMDIENEAEAFYSYCIEAALRPADLSMAPAID
jgi:transcriptional regulator with XRE-family HTH domain